MQNEELPIMCVGSWIIYCNPNRKVTPSILESPYVLTSLFCKRLDFALNHQELQLKNINNHKRIKIKSY